MEAGAEAEGATELADGVQAFSDEQAWDVLEEIPNDSAAALLLIEHHWAVPLRDAIARAGGFRVSDGFISPYDLSNRNRPGLRGGSRAAARARTHEPTPWAYLPTARRSGHRRMEVLITTHSTATLSRLGSGRNSNREERQCSYGFCS